MLPYWLLYIVFAVGAMVASPRSSVGSLAQADTAPSINAGYQSPRGGDPLLIAAVLATAIMIGFRYEVGGDWVSYRYIFSEIARRSFKSSVEVWEPGYVVLNLAAQQLKVGMWFVNTACALIFMFGLFRFARCQPNSWLAIAVSIPYLVIGVGMGYTRQSVAIGCVLTGLAALERGSFLRMVLWILAGTLFHRTAVVMLPLVSLAYSRNRLQTLAIAVVGLAIGYYVVQSSVSHLEKSYITTHYESQGAGFRLIMNLVPSAIFLVLSKRLTSDATVRAVWRNMSLAALAAFLIWTQVSSTVAVDRTALYLIPIQIFVFSRLPLVFGANGRPSLGMTALVIIYSGIVQFVWLVFANHAKFWIPYQVYPLFS